MRRLTGIFLLTFSALLLTACASRSAVTPTPTSPVASSALDGVWNGQGTTPGGERFDLGFTVQRGALTSVIYRFEGLGGLSCHVVALGQVASEEHPPILNDSISLSPDDRFTFSAAFTGTRAAGRMSIHRQDGPQRCMGDFEVAWSAEKTSSLPAVPSASTPPSAPHPLATFFQILVFGLSNGSILALNAIGVTIIYSTVRTLNLAHGDVFALTTALVTSVVNALGIRQDWPPLQLASALFVVLVAAMILAAVLSLGVEQLGFRPFRGASRLAPLIATLGLSFILFQGALVWRTFQRSWIPGEHRSVPGLPEVPTDGIPPLLPEINLAARLGIAHLVIRFSDVFVLLLALAFVGLATWFLQRTRTGRGIDALAQNPQMAQMLGVNINSTIRRAFAVGGAFAGAAAFIFALYYGRPFGIHGAQSGLLAFAAALLGGIGSPLGALLSGLTIGVFSSLSDYYVSAQWTSVLLLMLLILLLAWRPAGLTQSSNTGSALDLGSGPVPDSVILAQTSKGPRTRRWLILFLVPLGIFPILASVFGWSGQTILQTAEIYMLLALGLNVALGMAGLLDFGFAASFGLGAYAGALLSRFDATVALVSGALVAGLLGLVKGGLARRLRGDFLAVATLALGLLVSQAVVNVPGTGGASGLSGFSSFHLLGFGLARPTVKFYFILVFVVLAAFGLQRLLASRSGRAWVASREDETAALGLGVNVDHVRLVAFVLSSALAGIAGALYAGTLPYVDPETMSFHVTTLVLTMVILGGAGNVPGAILGAAAIVLYDKALVPRLADLLALVWPAGLRIGSAPDIRGASFFNFGIALYLTVLIRARRRKR